MVRLWTLRPTLLRVTCCHAFVSTKPFTLVSFVPKVSDRSSQGSKLDVLQVSDRFSQGSKLDGLSESPQISLGHVGLPGDG
jgi:hypothetical protein